MPNRAFDVDPVEYPFTSRWYERPQGWMHYIDEGAGIPVVMCHGNPTWSYLYRKIIRDLLPDCRCIAYDLPGFGYSGHPSAPFHYTPQEHALWVESLLLEHLKLDRFILVVQDWGGPIGLDIATRHPDKIIGVVISSTWAWPVPLLGKVFSLVLGSPLGRELNLRFNFFPTRLVAWALGPQARTASTLDAYAGPFPTRQSRAGVAAFPTQLRAASAWLEALEKRLHTLKKKPIAFVFGLKDVLTRPADMDRWLQHFPSADVQRDASAGHYTQEDCPQRYSVAIRRLLQKIT